MLNRIKQIAGIKKKHSIDRFFESSFNDFVVFCGDNTGANWLGIKNATLTLFPKNTFVLPQEFSHSLLTGDQLQSIVNHLNKTNIKRVILSGFPPYFEKIVKLCVEQKIKVSSIFHGSLSEFSGKVNNTFQTQITLLKNNELSSIGFIKDGLASVFHDLTNLTTYQLSLPIKKPVPVKKLSGTDNKIHIGVFGNAGFNKNRHNQVAAALMVPNSIVHIITPNEFDYLSTSDRIVEHNHMDYESFNSLVGSMNINLYCSFSESWGQIITDSLAHGVPCICSKNSNILAPFPELKNLLCVDNNDDPKEIADRVLKNLDLKINKYEIILRYNENALERVHTFVGSYE